MKKIISVVMSILMLFAFPSFSFAEDATYFTYSNDFSSSATDEYFTSSKNVGFTSGGLAQYGVGGNWGNIVVTNLPSIDTVLYTKYDLYNQQSASFKVVLTYSDNTTAYIQTVNGADTVTVSNGQTFSYDSSVMNTRFATFELAFDIANSKAVLYVTDDAGNRQFVTNEINISAANVVSLTYLVEGRAGGYNPLFDNLVISNDPSYYSDFEFWTETAEPEVPEEEAFDCSIDFAALCTSGATEVTDEHFEAIGTSYLNSAKGGWYCKAESEGEGSGFTINVNGENSAQTYVEAYVNLVWTSSLKIRFISEDGLSEEVIYADGYSSELLDNNGRKLSGIAAPSGGNRYHTIGVLTDSENDLTWIYYDGKRIGTSDWSLDALSCVDFTFHKNVTDDLRPWACSVKVTSDSSKFPGEIKGAKASFTYENNYDGESALTNDAYFSGYKINHAGKKLIQVANAATWGYALINGIDPLSAKAYIKFDLYLYSPSLFKVAIYNADDTISNANVPNYVQINSTTDTIVTSTGQTYSYDASSIVGSSAVVELELDTLNRRGALYITPAGGTRVRVADDMDINAYNITAVKFQVEGKSSSNSAPIIDNVLITDNSQRFASDYYVSELAIDDSSEDTVKAGINVVNWNTGTDYSSVVALAAYNGNKLENISLAKADAPSSSIISAWAELSKTDVTGHTVKAFMINGTDKLTPVGTPVIYGE